MVRCGMTDAPLPPQAEVRAAPPPAGVTPEGMARTLENVLGGSTEHFAKLRPAQREYFLALAAPYLEARGEAAAVDALIDIDYEVRPPTPEQFLSCTDYVPTDMARELFPAWRPIILKACQPGGRVFEVNITGASGNGKTTAAMLILDYKMVRTFCLRDPAAFFGLQARTMIYFGLYATTKRLIKDVGFYVLRDMLMDPAPFWRDRYPRLKQGQEYIRWPQKRIEVITGSSELHALGRALLGVAADELNYYNMGEKTAQRAPDLVAEVSRRLETRFLDKAGDIPGIAIYISQTRTTTDYLENRIREKKDHPGVLCVRGPRWAFSTKGYNHPDGFHPGQDPVFRVFTGTDTTDPRILDRVVRMSDGVWHVSPADAEDSIPDGGNVIDVPVQHYRAFIDDLHGALRNIADVPSGSYTPFFPRREVVFQAFTRDPAVVYPFSSQSIPCYEGGVAQLQDAYDIKRVTRVHMGRLLPVRHPDAPRYIHLDLSQGGDRTGMAMVHPSGHYREDTPAALDAAGVGAGEMVKAVEVDFYVALTSGPYGEPIDFGKIRVFVDWLRRCGYWVRMVTTDQFMAFDMRQRIREMGIPSELQSVDRTSGPYRDFRQAMGEGRVVLPVPPGLSQAGMAGPGTVVPEEILRRVILAQELLGLEHDVKRDKVEHRAQNPDGSKGSKDVADGAAGAVYRCLTDDTVPSGPPGTPTARSVAEVRLGRYLSKLP